MMDGADDMFGFDDKDQASVLDEYFAKPEEAHITRRYTTKGQFDDDEEEEEEEEK